MKEIAIFCASLVHKDHSCTQNQPQIRRCTKKICKHKYATQRHLNSPLFFIDQFFCNTSKEESLTFMSV